MMSIYLNEARWQSAAERARQSLSKKPDAAFTTEEINVFLKYLLLDCQTNAARIKANLSVYAEFNTQLTEILAVADERLPGTAADKAIIQSTYYRERLFELVLETIRSEPLAPELCIKLSLSTPAEFAQNAPGKHHHAVIFSAAIGFIHELYPLIVDAYVYDSDRFGCLQTNVLGVHSDWLDEHERLTRVIYYDFASARFIETGLSIPISADSVQFLCLGAQEQTQHAELSQRFHCPQVNPATVAHLADDKAATLAAWQHLGISIPITQVLAPNDLSSAYTFLEQQIDIVVKPNQATEGQCVAYFHYNQAQVQTALQSHLKTCWAQGVTLIQQRCDNVAFRHPTSGQLHSLALRLNLAFDGKHYVLESGYAQLGQDIYHPASVGQGGQIISIDNALSNLVTRCASPQAILITVKAWQQLHKQAIQAARVFNGLLLIGMDVLLNYDAQGQLSFLCLEVNPRPSGLCHSKLLAEHPLQTMPNGLSLKLWERLAE
ncbi:MAG: hypothetical protein K9L60_07595 [Methylovulum sp.]|nr:hypothetical protein [Methylovulum sp.]MCF7998161.1 hypothetical protein [Methylovulum sp.]